VGTKETLAKGSEEQKQLEIYVVDVGDKTLAFEVGCKVSRSIK